MLKRVDSLDVLKKLNKYNNSIIDDYTRYDKDIGEYTLTSNISHQRHEYSGKGRYLHIWSHPDHGSSKDTSSNDNLQHFPNIKKLMDDVNKSPDIKVSGVMAAIKDGPARVNLHTDDDHATIKLQSSCPMDGREVFNYRAHIPIIIPENCHFYHIEDPVEKTTWKIGDCFAFNKADKHFTVSTSTETRVILEFDFFMAVTPTG